MLNDSSMSDGSLFDEDATELGAPDEFSFSIPRSWLAPWEFCAYFSMKRAPVATVMNESPYEILVLQTLDGRFATVLTAGTLRRVLAISRNVDKAVMIAANLARAKI
jgi:hypothetical protein